MNKRSVYTCETCSALFLCLKYFQDHRKKHALGEKREIYPCNFCPSVHESNPESKLHAQTHQGESPHSCEVCQENLSISEEHISGSRRSIGTATDNHVFNVAINKPITTYYQHPENVGEVKAEEHEDDDDNNEDDDDDDDEDDGEEDDEDDEDDGDEDEDDDDDEDEDDDDDEEEDEEGEIVNSNSANSNSNNNNRQLNDLAICQPNVNIIYVTNQTITTSQQKNGSRPSRPSRSTGKGKGNRKARLTCDGDIRRKFSCCHCGKSFKTKSHLQRHILTHTGEKPYHCNRCDCRFNQSSSLRNHVIAIHTKEFPHSCTNCSKGFLMPALLQKHLQTCEKLQVENNDQY